MYNIKECREDSGVKHKSLAEEMYVIAKTEKEIKDKKEFDRWLRSNGDLLDDIRNKIREAAYKGLFQLEVRVKLENIKFIVKYLNNEGFAVTSSEVFHSGIEDYKYVRIAWGHVGA